MTTAIARSRGVGQYVAAEGHTAMYPRTYKPSSARRGLIYLGGRSAIDSAFGEGAFLDYSRGIVEQLRVPGISIDTEETWGNDTITDRIELARAYLGTALGATVTKVLVVGGSMGALNALGWAKRNPTKVQALALTTPAVNLSYMHDNDVGGWQAEIETAYGGTAGWNAAKASHDPYLNTASYTGMPAKVWYATDDPYIVPAHATTFASAIGASVQSMGAVGHTVTAPYFHEIVDFLLPYVS